MSDCEVVVIGSVNMDLYSIVSRMPLEGETLASEHYIQTPGGKAVNQAVAAARMGRKTALIGRVGRDAFGQEIKNRLLQDGIAEHLIVSEKEHTGVSFVLMDQHGNNSIITNLGANKTFSIADAKLSLAIAKQAKIALLQLEMEKETRDFILKELRKHGIKIILNLAPVVEMSTDVRRLADILVVNRVEAEQLTNQEITDKASAKRAADFMFSEGNEIIIITLGAEGVLVKHKSRDFFIEAPKVKAVDTTGAGDCFCGSLAAFLLEDDLHTAVQKAVIASAQSVTKYGTMDSIPFLHELNLN